MTSPTQTDNTSKPTPVNRMVVILAGVIALLHLMNFLNYSNLRYLANFPLLRSAVLIIFTLSLFLGSPNQVIRYHFRKSWDIYAFCLLCFLSSAISVDISATLIYSIWLILSCYAALELARRVETIQEIQVALLIIVVPSTLFSFLTYLYLGPNIQHTGRVFGALGTVHVDVAMALDLSLLLLAIYSLPKQERLPLWVLPQWMIYALLPYLGYLIIFGLTRSVWIGFTLGLLLFFSSNKKSAGIFGAGIILSFLILIAVGLTPSSIVPDAVKDRVELTESRIDSGQIDGRVNGMRFAMTSLTDRPTGYGYGAGVKCHNSYLDVLLGTGVPGFVLMIATILRSIALCRNMQRRYFRFFMIGCAGLLVHAFFETQATPGQANFLLLVTWLCMTRSPFVSNARERLRA